MAAPAAPPRRLRLPVPVTILTGALGSGKTTALRHLIARKPDGEVWAVVVNEFGAVGVDGAALEGAAAAAAAAAAPAGSAGAGGAGGVSIRQIAGGCMCCTTSGMLTPALAQIVRAVKPDRLLIEPSGLGHPGGLVDVLQGPHLRSALELRAIICLVRRAGAAARVRAHARAPRARAPRAAPRAAPGPAVRGEQRR